jgi:N-hydroxyarylamine O-acetyltransferase
MIETRTDLDVDLIPDTLDPALVERYLDRLGLTSRPAPTLDGLTRVQEAHVLRVPFENLDYHTGADIHMDTEVVTKIVDGRRGGGCYELNPSRHYLLLSLGFSSRIMAARSYVRGVLGPPNMHLVLEVTIEGRPYLVDAGFRRNSRRPLLITEGGEQQDPHGSYRVTAEPRVLEVSLDRRPLYQVDRGPATIADFAPTLWWWRTCPDSPFLQSIFCSLPTEHGRVTLTGNRLVVKDETGVRAEQLDDQAALLQAYSTWFGIELPAVPQLSALAGRRPGINLE